MEGKCMEMQGQMYLCGIVHISDGMLEHRQHVSHGIEVDTRIVACVQQENHCAFDVTQ